MTPDPAVPLSAQSEQSYTLETHTFDLRPSWVRHPVQRFRWWRYDRAETRRRRELGPEGCAVEDEVNRMVERYMFFGDDS